jgi:monovalent cation:proton antiporter-2 (CPA2) family protein
VVDARGAAARIATAAPPQAALSMADAPPLAQLLVLLGAIVVVVPAVQRLGLGSVPGYLIAGLLIGPSGLALVNEHVLIGAAAEFGVVFLLFAVGIELSPPRLWLLRRLVFGLGSAQLLSAALLIALLAAWGLHVDAAAATVIGFGLALSSTALVLQVLGERRELATTGGRAALAVLLLQDVAVAPLVSLAYVLGGGGPGGDVVLPDVLRSIGLLLLFVIVGRLALHRALPLVASSRNPDLLVAASLLLVLGAAWLVELAGFSLALGAFLAGVLLADSSFRHQVVADLHPFRGILLGVFFLTVGMSLELHTALDHAPALLALTLGFMLLKTLLLAVAARLFGLATDQAVRLGLQLAQGGEFALVLFALAAQLGLLEARLASLLLQSVALSLLLAPLAFYLGDRITARLGQSERPLLEPPAADAMLTGHAVICGFGRVGSQLANLFEAAGQRWVAADQRPEVVELARLAGLPVFFGDASRPAILQALGIAEAAVAVVTLDDPEAAERCVHTIRQQAPLCRVVARSADLGHARTLHEHGATRAVPETAEYSLQLGLAGLAAVGLEGARLQQLEDAFREADYRRLHANRVGLPHRR